MCSLYFYNITPYYIYSDVYLSSVHALFDLYTDCLLFSFAFYFYPTPSPQQRHIYPKVTTKGL